MTEPLSSPDADALSAIVRRTVGRFADALRTTDAGTAIPHLEWSVGELGRHVLGALRQYGETVTTGTRTWATFDLDAENARTIQRTPERTSPEIADAIPAALDRFVHGALSRPDADVPWIAGTRITPAIALAVVATDVLVHGWDLARATRRRWPMPVGDVAVAVAGILHVVPLFVAPAAAGIDAVFALRLRGGATFALRFSGGELTVTEGRPDQADCRISTDPAAFLLVSYGRVPAPRAALTGKVVAFGRKPWLGLRLPSLLDNP